MLRKKYHELLAHLPKRELTVLIGARQTGKSTLLKQLAEALTASGETVVSLNLERRDVLLDLNQSPEHIFKYLPAGSNRRSVALIDEVQYLDDPTNFLKLLYDEHADRLKIVATGSSAFYIDRQFKDSLAGRKKIFELQTLDFEEFLLFRGQDTELLELQRLRSGEVEKSVAEPRLWAALETYLTYGGYPAVVLENETRHKVERLHDLKDSFVKRDILESGVTDETKFYRLMMLLAAQIGNLVNTNELANTLQITHATTDHFLYVLQKCFHLGLVRPFYQNLRKELVKMPKAYFLDLGLRNVLVNYFAPLEQRPDKGALLENYAFRRLTERYAQDQIKFWRTADGNEVDFVVEETAFGGRAIEAKFSPAEAKPNKYRKFTEAYPQFPLEFWAWGDRGLLG
ncbi:MAG: ATP-binding protein [Saprospiraceae bacterium]